MTAMATPARVGPKIARAGFSSLLGRIRAPKISVLDRVMNQRPLALPALKALSDDVLLTRLTEIVARGRRVEAEVIAHIAEVDARRLYLGQACSSMHAYATERLRLSDAE